MNALRVVVCASLAACATAPTSRPDVARQLAPTGRLRAAINFGNPVLAQKDPATGEARGASVDLARELGRRLSLPVDLVPFDAAGKVVEAIKTDAWDVAFLAVDPERAAEIAFTAAYLEIPATYLVPQGSTIRSVAEVDRDGVRIAVADKSAYELWLSRNIKHAKLMKTQASTPRSTSS